MHCPTCGAAVGDDDRFCRACGAPVTVRAEAVAADPPLPPLSPRESWPPPGLPHYPRPGTDAGGAPAPATPLWGATQVRAGGPVAAFGAPLARWWSRVGAMLLDGLILGIPAGIVTVVVFAATATTHVVVVGGVVEQTKVVPAGIRLGVYLVFSLASAGYFAGFNGLGRGQTPGNRRPDIAVRDARTGRPIGFWRGLLRWFVRAALYAAFVVPGLVNDLFPLWHPRRQTLADLAARSVMVEAP